MNIKSEQLRSDLSLDVAYDQVLKNKEIKAIINNALGNNCFEIKFKSKKLLAYRHGDIVEIFLYKAISYLGGVHLTFKKRIQLPKWYKEVCTFFSDKSKYSVRFIGVYHYEKNIIFVDFLKDSYLKRKMNNSAAHIYTNDLFQAMKEGVFKKIDKNNNIAFTIQYNKFNQYILGKEIPGNTLFDLFIKFNYGFPFGIWIKAIDAIQELYKKNWRQWKQTEWAGWFLEYKFSNYIEEHNLESKIKYIGNINKKTGDLDFDLWFDEYQFYGDLKASDIKVKESPGNDQVSFIECINKHDKFWYIIYEHNTLKDIDANNNFEATRERTQFIKSIEKTVDSDFNELSYYKRMKHSVQFEKMSIIELNRINFREILSDFNQGHQPNGASRNPKFKITKNNIDNFVVFRYEYSERGTKHAEEF